ncbi:MAG: pentapeptide repeat-containing protein [Chloroflexi bacterium]|nr:pentapeptide repeat-containing protein [Chloroflexota bacterium]
MQKKFGYIRTLKGEYFSIYHKYFITRLRNNKFIKLFLICIISTTSLFLIIKLILLGYRFSWTGFANNSQLKTLWDWLELLIIPMLLGFLAYLFTNSQKSREIELTKINQQNETLQQYFNQMTSLLLEIDNFDDKTIKTTSRIARATTLAVLEIVDGKQKGQILRFLTEAELINKESPFILLKRANFTYTILDLLFCNTCDLNGINFDYAILPWSHFNNSMMSGISMRYANLANADFSNSDLAYVLFTNSNLSHAKLSMSNLYKGNFQNSNLRNADLSKAHIHFANFYSANLQHANLESTNLHFSDFSCTSLRDADLSNSDLSNTNFYGADLRNANLTGVNLIKSSITKSQLKKAKSYKNARLPF